MSGAGDGVGVRDLSGLHQPTETPPENPEDEDIMGRIVANFFIALDGVVESPDQWHFPYFNDEMGAVVNAGTEKNKAFLMGRRLYDEWSAYWPESTDEPFATWINRTPKYVASTTLQSVDEWQNSTLIKGPVPEFVADLRQREGGTIGTAGSPTLVRSLLDAGMVDELVLLIHPVVAGGGRKRLFADDGALTRFELVGSQPTSSGVLIATYRPVR